jgi:hypothetical protein
MLTPAAKDYAPSDNCRGAETEVLAIALVGFHVPVESL